MYVALVCPYDLRRPGGVKNHIVGLGSALAARGHRVEVIAPSPPTHLGGLDVVACGSAREFGFSGTRIDFTWAPWEQVRTVARRGYDVMHFHTIWNPLVPFQLATLYRGPSVATFHDVPGVDTPRVAAAMMGPVSSMIASLAVRRVIGVSPAVGQYLAPAPHDVVPNGIAAPGHLPPEGDRRAVLYLGRLEPRKDVATLLHAMATLGGSAPPLWIAGDGPLAADLQTLAHRLDLRDVTFFGEVDEDMKWRLLRRAATLVAPSVAGESFGIVLTEAMVAGAVPIGADNPGYSAVLAERGTELLFRGGNAAELGQRIASLCNSPERLASLREWGDAEWRRYDWNLLVDRILTIYEAAGARPGVTLPSPVIGDGGALVKLAAPPAGSLTLAPQAEELSA